MLDIDAMTQPTFPYHQHPTIHRDRPSMVGMDEFEIGQQFVTKEEVVLTVKNYNIRRGVEYKYHGKCVQFGNRCNWLICVTMWQRKGYWEVRNYNEPHTCLATEISKDHKCISLDEGILVSNPAQTPVQPG
ncbi:hypothetical protein Ahy_A06g027666 [Arachis hypogaea]|uniref:Transposase MuDR plant domain-containing protein n=1 Tax=Arachis hypogaea TaxID=3818 RepID=A0A445CPE3_ARAHY|nr:hypothetical protein Ahy_A06g027666 [Arachis hypogaea]